MRKKIIFIIDSPFPFYSGGRETWLYQILSLLNKERYEITIINKKSRGKQKPFFKLKENVKIISIPNIPKFIKSKWPLGTFFNLINEIIFSAMAYKKIKSQYGKLKNKPIIFTLNPGFCSYPAYLNKKNGFKYFCTVRGKYAPERVQNCFAFKKIWFGFFRKLEIKTLRGAEKVLSNGFDTKENLKNYLDIKTFEKVKVLPNGVDFNKYSQISILKEEIILTIASLRDIKGIPEIIKSIPYVKNKKIKFFFAGKGNQKPYKNLAKKLQVMGRVKFLGERKDIPDLLSRSKISITISGGSGISHACLESLSSGTITIGINNLTYSQLITNKKNGFLIKNRNSKLLGAKINEILDNFHSFKKIQENAKKSAAIYDWKRIYKLFKEYVKE
jgi:glycosyltransferase involved in cell wall biosynthesis